VREVAALVAAGARGHRFEVGVRTAALRGLGVDPGLVGPAARGEPTALGAAADAAAQVAAAMAGPGPVGDAAVRRLADVLGAERFVEVATVAGYFLLLGDLARLLDPDPDPDGDGADTAGVTPGGDLG
jgi:hypothetical protein